MSKKKFIICFIFFLVVLSPFSAFSAEDIYGEIININYEYEIAFTDLSNYYLNPGDIVEIFSDGKFVTYLEVSQASSAISRLIPVKDVGKFETTVDFNVIKVGSAVKKFNINASQKKITTEKNNTQKNNLPSKAEVEKTTLEESQKKEFEKDYAKENKQDNKTTDLSVQFKNLSDNYIALSNSLAEIISQKKIIESENSRYQNELSQLKQKIEKFETDNVTLESKLKSSKDEKSSQLNEQIIKENKELKKLIAILKSKLNYMSEIIQKGK